MKDTQNVRAKHGSDVTGTRLLLAEVVVGGDDAAALEQIWGRRQPAAPERHVSVRGHDWHIRDVITQWVMWRGVEAELGLLALRLQREAGQRHLVTLEEGERRVVLDVSVVMVTADVTLLICQ